MARKLIIDLDPGIGDALAAVLALLDPALDVLALTATAGCVPGDVATRNLQAIVAQVDSDRWPRIGAAAPEGPVRERIVPPTFHSLEFLNGPSGLGDCQPPVAELHHVRESCKVLIESVRAHPHQVTVLTLGPLTNIAAAQERDPQFLSLLESLVCLGGSVGEGGDVTAAAEFNIFSAPEAARSVLTTLDPKVLVPLDVTNKVSMTYEAFQKLTEGSMRCREFLTQLLPYSFRAHHQFLGMEGIQLREVTALAVVSQPKLFRIENLALDVETQGEVARGATICDRRRFFECPSNASVALEADVQGILDYFQRVLKG